jgi:hypothetical protein
MEGMTLRDYFAGQAIILAQIAKGDESPAELAAEMLRTHGRFRRPPSRARERGRRMTANEVTPLISRLKDGDNKAQLLAYRLHTANEEKRLELLEKHADIVEQYPPQQVEDDEQQPDLI